MISFSFSLVALSYNTIHMIRIFTLPPPLPSSSLRKVTHLNPLYNLPRCQHLNISVLPPLQHNNFVPTNHPPPLHRWNKLHPQTRICPIPLINPSISLQRPIRLNTVPFPRLWIHIRQPTPYSPTRSVNLNSPNLYPLPTIFIEGSRSLRYYIRAKSPDT